MIILTKNPIAVFFPLKGVWQVVASPGDHVPSHYTHAMGMTYAFDFAKPADAETFFSRVKGIPVEACEAWNEEVLSPFDGQVVYVEQSVSDRKHVHFVCVPCRECTRC